jgi:SAM-dependent MidA family methyltransferase
MTEASEHAARLAADIAARIAADGGWWSFARYMQAALYTPGLGYYSAGAVKFGAAGDFVTAPEISPLFARAIARFLDPVLASMQGGSVLELGPGSGRFVEVALQEFAALGTPLAEYALLEVSADLRDRQQHKLQSVSLPLRWLDTLPENFRGVIFGNEVIDALPCERFVIRDGIFCRLGVGCKSANEPRFEWRVRPPDGSVADDATFLEYAERLRGRLAARGIELADGYVGEWHPDLGPWLHSVADALQHGGILLVDYGLPEAQLYHPQRTAGTLRCHRRHQADEDPFTAPGITDITAWVNFTEVATCAEQAGLKVEGFTTQAGFLLGGDIETLFADAYAGSMGRDDPHALLSAAQGLRRLVLPGEMGEAVKFIWLTRGLDSGSAPPHFARQDMRHSL